MTCCEHRGADHDLKSGTTSTASAGAKCTVPGCKCPGWIPRKRDGTSRDPKGPRRGAKIFVNGEGPYPTEWVDGVHRFKPNLFVQALFDLSPTLVTTFADDERREVARLIGSSLADYMHEFPNDKIRYRVRTSHD